jgi:hypothetical protein
MADHPHNKAAKVRNMKIAQAVRKAETGRSGKGSRSKAQNTDSNNKRR